MAEKLLFLDYDGTIIPREDDFSLIDEKFRLHLDSFLCEILAAAKTYGFTVSILTNSSPGWVQSSMTILAPEIWEKHIQHLTVYHAVDQTGLDPTAFPKLHMLAKLVPANAHLIGIGDLQDDRYAVMHQSHASIRKSILFLEGGSIQNLISYQQQLQSNINFVLSYSDDIDHVMTPVIHADADAEFDGDSEDNSDISIPSIADVN